MCLTPPAGLYNKGIVSGMVYPTYTYTTAKPSSTSGVPSSIPSGTIQTCNKYTLSNAGGSCATFASRVGISLPHLYAWNRVFGNNGENCTAKFQANAYYCVSISKSLPAPGPVQAGVIDTCVNYTMSNAGGTCAAFASRTGVPLLNLYAWNIVLGTTGQNCAQNFLGNVDYCTAVAGAGSSGGTPTQDPNQPRQSGTISTCTKYTKSNPDGTCQYFAPNNNITLAQLYAWNSVLGYHGENCGTKFLGSEFYCTGVSGLLPAPGPVQAGVVDICTVYAKSNPDGAASISRRTTTLQPASCMRGTQFSARPEKIVQPSSWVMGGIVLLSPASR